MDKQEGHLDPDELLHLAIADSRKGAHDEAIKRLKYLIDIAPDRADAVFMLAAEHAELGMYDRAAEGMHQALELNPELHTARMQLGLLYFRAGNLDAAQEAWGVLQEQLPQGSALRLFPEAMLALAANRTDAAIGLLEEALNDRSNPALVTDIERMLERLRGVAGITADPAHTDTTGDASAPAVDGDDAATRQLLANYEKHSRDREH